MPALDLYREAVHNALIKDGWTITHDPLSLLLEGDRVFIDLGAERLLAAEKGIRKIAVEVKTFTGPSRMTDLERARELYLAVPQDTVDDLFHNAVGRGFLEDEHGKVFGFDSEAEEVREWLP